ncbi:MAG: heat-inducible transcription repressor HrcA [Acidobacteria bacterium]|nr:heat-inducible transcription repressor HrcA [Acidobacteriota bacterium]
MKSAPEEGLLTERDRVILKDVIVSYILSAEPVSSRAVAKRGGLGLSAASIRNVMADLEELGFLSQPHSSAGRVPTPKAYHLYIRSMMDEPAVSSSERRYIDENLASESKDADELMAAASQLLSELTHQVGVVLTPALAETVLKTIDFVPLSERKVLCVVVSTSGFVDNKVILTREPVAREDLVRISNYLTENFAGLALREVRNRILGMMAEERAQVDRLLAQTIRLAKAGLSLSDYPEILVEGAQEVLQQPELSDIARIRCLFDTFADKARLVFLLTQCMEGHGVRVVIGDESDVTSALDFSLVTSAYGSEGRVLGALGIFGPSRMEYQRVIPLVDYLGERLSQALAATFAADA